MGKFGSPQLGKFADGYKEIDNPNLNKCPNCGALTDSNICPICKTRIPINMMSGNRRSIIYNRDNRIYCQYCGSDNPIGYYKCNVCGRKRQTKKALISLLFILIIIEALLITSLLSYIQNEGLNSNSSNVNKQTYQNNNIEEDSTNTSSELDSQTIDYYKSLCSDIDYITLARNPESHKGEFLTVTGKVIQVMDNNGSFDLRMDITEGSYGIWDDTIYATVTANSNGERILEGDIIKIYGICAGLYSYESVIGTQITLPKIDAPFYEFIEN